MNILVKCYSDIFLFIQGQVFLLSFCTGCEIDYDEYSDGEDCLFIILRVHWLSFVTVPLLSVSFGLSLALINSIFKCAKTTIS